ncbi:MULTISPECIES: hypothetical protein [Microbacterium]|uniref:hypothetical protein n=1 Tax=Microbacterium TaxID=33882 RepID=UPI0011EB79AA|nr:MULTISPECIES: hypothetical protein [Microbacterium]
MLSEVIAWLNANSGAIGALAAILSAVFTAAAALAAFVSIRHSRRRERCNMDAIVNTSVSAFGGDDDYRPMIHLYAYNRGPASPLVATYDFDHHLGDSIPMPLAPGATVELTQQLVSDCREWRFIRISWMEPDGRKRRIKFWYRVEGQFDDPSNQRKYLRVDRDERAGYFLGAHYLRRHIPPWDFVRWKYRKLKRRREIRRQSNRGKG